MGNYSKAKIYKIYNDIDDEIYIGSTCSSLAKRMAKHRYSAKVDLGKTNRLYKKMNELGKEHFFIVLIDEFHECENKEQLHKKEREKIEELKPRLNYFIPTRTYQEWVEENHEHKKELDRVNYREKREERIEYQRQYAKDHPEKVKEYRRTCYLNNKEKYDAWHKKIVKCEHCGLELQRGSLSKHTKKQHS